MFPLLKQAAATPGDPTAPGRSYSGNGVHECDADYSIYIDAATNRDPLDLQYLQQFYWEGAPYVRKRSGLQLQLPELPLHFLRVLTVIISMTMMVTDTRTNRKSSLYAMPIPIPLREWGCGST